MATIIDTLTNTVQDELPRVVHESFRGLDPVYEKIDQTFNDVSAAAADMGYKWQVNHLFSGGLAGLIYGANPLGPDINTNTYYSTTNMFIDSTDTDLAPFPTATEAPHAYVTKRTLALHMNTGNFSIPVSWLQMDKLDLAKVKQVAMDIEAIGKLRALMEVISFYAQVANGYKVLGQINGTPSTPSPYKTSTFAIVDGRIAYFRPGMMVEIYTNSSGPNANIGTNKLMVSHVDFLDKTITVTQGGSLSDTAIDGYASIAKNAWVLLKGHTTQYRPMVTWGIQDWIKSSGYLFQTGASSGFSLTTYPHFSSQVVSVGSALSDSALNGYVGGFIDAYGDAAPDTIITTWGVTLKYLQAPNSSSLDRMLFERTGQPLKVTGGFAPVEFVFNGRKMTWMVSSYCLPGHLYGLKTGGGNIKRYVPPRVGGSDSRIGAEIEFLAPVGGHSGIFKIAHNGDGASLNLLEAPFWQYRLVAPIDVRSIKLYSLTEATMS